MSHRLLIALTILGSGALIVIVRWNLSAWLRSRASGFPVSLRDLTYVRRKRAKVRPVTTAYIVARKMGIVISVRDLADLYNLTSADFTVKVRELVTKSLAPKPSKANAAPGHPSADPAPPQS